MAKMPAEKVGLSRCDDRTPQRGVPTKLQKPSALLDIRVVYCGDNLEQLGPYGTCQCWGSPREIMPRASTHHPLHRISRGETKEKRAFEDRHENTKAYIDYMCIPTEWQRCVKQFKDSTR